MFPKFELVPIITYFITLPKVRRPSRTPRSSTDEIGLEQDDVGRILGDIDGRIDGDADIGGMQGGRVIDAVAHEADDMAAPLQGQDDAVLLRGRDAAEEVDLLDPRAQGLLAERRHLGAGEDAGNRNFQRAAEVMGHPLIVAGQDLDRDAASPEGLDGRPAPCLGGSRKAAKPAKTSSCSSPTTAWG